MQISESTRISAPSELPTQRAEYPAGVDPRAPNLPTREERAELDAVALLCEVVAPMRDDVRRVVSERQGSYPVWCYRAAVEELRGQPPNKHTGKYLLGILKNQARLPPPAKAQKPEEIEAAQNQKNAELAEKFRQYRAKKAAELLEQGYVDRCDGQFSTPYKPENKHLAIAGWEKRHGYTYPYDLAENPDQVLTKLQPDAAPTPQALDPMPKA